MARSFARLIGRLFSADRPTLDVLGAALIAVGAGMVFVPAGFIVGGVALIVMRMAQETSS